MQKKIEFELDENDEVLEATVKPTGTTGRVNVRKKHVGKRATIIIHARK